MSGASKGAKNLNSFEEENTDKALEYLSLGREQFADNGDLLDHEINLYIKLEQIELQETSNI